MSADTLLVAPSHIEARALTDAAGRPVRPCGVGLVAAALGASRLLAAHTPERVLLLGLAGTRDTHRADLAQVVVGTHAFNEGVGAGAGAGFVPLAAMGIPDEPVAPDVLPLADPGPSGGDLPRLGLGCVAAASASLAEAAAHLEARPDAVLEDMESWAVAVACRDAGVPLAVVRAVSNVAGQRDKGHWRLAESLAALGAWAADL